MGSASSQQLVPHASQLSDELHPALPPPAPPRPDHLAHLEHQLGAQAPGAALPVSELDPGPAQFSVLVLKQTEMK